MNPFIAHIKTVPGRYIISNAQFMDHGNFSLVEVDDQQRVFSLDPHGVEAPKLLADEGWVENTIVLGTVDRLRAFKLLLQGMFEELDRLPVQQPHAASKETL